MAFDEGRVMLGGAGIEDADALAKWVERGAKFAASLPRK
jgi:hypothetical protein